MNNYPKYVLQDSCFTICDTTENIEKFFYHPNIIICKVSNYAIIEETKEQYTPFHNRKTMYIISCKILKKQKCENVITCITSSAFQLSYKDFLNFIEDDL